MNMVVVKLTDMSDRTACGSTHWTVGKTNRVVSKTGGDFSGNTGESWFRYFTAPTLEAARCAAFMATYNSPYAGRHVWECKIPKDTKTQFIYSGETVGGYGTKALTGVRFAGMVRTLSEKEHRRVGFELLNQVEPLVRKHLKTYSARWYAEWCKYVFPWIAQEGKVVASKKCCEAAAEAYDHSHRFYGADSESARVAAASTWLATGEVPPSEISRMNQALWVFPLAFHHLSGVGPDVIDWEKCAALVR
jgi:hypothetical protein